MRTLHDVAMDAGYDPAEIGTIVAAYCDPKNENLELKIHTRAPRRQTVTYRDPDTRHSYTVGTLN